MSLISKTNELPHSDPNWRPKLTNLSLSASKFQSDNAGGAGGANQSIETFFKVSSENENDFVEQETTPTNTKQIETKSCSETKNSDKIETVLEEESVISEVEHLMLEKCDKCGKNVSPFDLPEHLDFHMAKDLQHELRQQDQQVQVQQRSSVILKSTAKRKGQLEKSDSGGNKKQKTIATFFTKK